jgi:F0F1-type ATP synthase assembly protein I
VNDCEVGLELAGGKIVSIPSQYFAGFKAREQARPFAAKLARALRVLVTESR